MEGEEAIAVLVECFEETLVKKDPREQHAMPVSMLYLLNGNI